MLDPKALHVFATLSEERHFARTAARLGLAQSVVSTMLARLEDQLGVRLLERGQRTPVRLTRTGETFLAEARRALTELSRAEAIGRLAGREQAGDVKLGFVFSAAVTGVLAQMLQGLKAEFPALKVMPEPMDSLAQIEAVAYGRLSLGVIRLQINLPAEVEIALIHREALVLALPAQHPLSACERVSISKLAAENFIVPQYANTPGLADHVRRLAKAGGFYPPPFIDAPDYVSALSLVSSCFGVSLVPKSMARLQLNGVAYRPFTDYSDEVALALIWRRGGQNVAVEALCGLFGVRSLGASEA